MFFSRPIQWYHSHADPICRKVPRGIWQPDVLTTRIDLIHKDPLTTRIDLVHKDALTTRIDLIHKDAL